MILTETWTNFSNGPSPFCFSLTNDRWNKSDTTRACSIYLRGV